MNHPDARIQSALDRLASPRLATIDLSLTRVTGLLSALGNPQEKLPPVVHVAGTNGKGSLLAYLTAILQAAGYRVHRYISPHLVQFNERIMLCGKEIEDEFLLELLGRIEAQLSHPVTFFEATTAAAFLAFSQVPADVLLLETGLGGRLDATNVVNKPLLTAITPISMDHMDYLGDTLVSIAREKAGIIKDGVPCVVGPQLAEVALALEAVATARRAALFRAGREWSVEAQTNGFHYRSQWRDGVFPFPGLAGGHQIANAATAIACIERMTGFTVSDAQLAQGILNTKWPARLQRLATGALAALLPQGVQLWLDGGHNPGAGEVLADWARAQKKPVHLICGMLGSKDTRAFLAPLVPYAESLTAVPISGETLSQPPEVIAGFARDCGIKNITMAQDGNIKRAIETIIKNEKRESTILICGSLYLAGNILWLNSQAL